MKIALIIGISGQDGAYLTKLLLEKGYRVHGIRRATSTVNTGRLDYILKDNFKKDSLSLHYGDVLDMACMVKYITEIQPDEIYNLAAQSHVHVSFSVPIYTGNVDGIAVVNILEAVKNINPKIKIYQASTSEMYGLIQESIQTENTPFYPRSPYGAAKLYAHWMVKNYREAYGLFATSGILFNHESPIRGGQFVTRKITKGFAKILSGTQNKLSLGNLNATRDWGHARDYVEAMWMMLQEKKPDDYVVATGRTTSIRKFTEIVAENFGVRIEWIGTGLSERAVVDSLVEHAPLAVDPDTAKSLIGKTIVDIDQYFFRPTEVDVLCGDYSKIKNKMGWQPKATLEQLAKEMCEYDFELALLEKKYASNIKLPEF